ncbi:hypothetical protein KR222_002563 [Zaprionus bogoriensis]|nr:hypothetical protein KR222_002563 [Zaprionus bogoriensis]
MYNPKEKDIDLVREYFPSYHTARFQDQAEPNLAVQDHFLRLTVEHGKALIAQQGVKVHNLRYGGTNDNQVVDVFYSDAAEAQPSPLLVYIHGGYWQMLDKSNSCSPVGPLVRRGYRVAVVDYNNCPQVTLPQLLEQFTGFLLWLFDYADRTQATSISFAGHSAGAHLLAQLLHVPGLISEQHRRKVQALFFICGVYDLRELWSLEPVNPGNIFGLNAHSAAELSPMLWPWAADSPHWPGVKSYVISTKHESVTFIEQSREFALKLSHFGFDVMFKLFDSYDHFDIIEETNDDDSTITTYLLEELQRTSK